MAEQIDIKKAGRSIFSSLDWFKSLAIGLKIFFIVFILYTGYRAWFVPKNEQSNQITVEEGGTLNLKQSQGDNKRFQTFGEVYGFCETDGRYGGGVRAGLKF